MDPINPPQRFRPEYSFAEYGIGRDDSPGAPTAYMPSPMSGIVDPPKYSSASRMPPASSVELRKENPASQNKTGSVTSTSTRRLFHICLVFASRSLGLLAGLLTCVVGMSRLYQQSVTLRWPESGQFFSDATNSNTWRQQLFTLHPDILFDLWTPLIFGISSILAHLRWFEICSMTKTFWHCSVWNVLQALWANLGYCGGLGILVGGVSLAAAFINLITACLSLHAKVSCVCNSPTQLNNVPQPQSVFGDTGTHGDVL